jgi:LacI family kdg operon repressor
LDTLVIGGVKLNVKNTSRVTLQDVANLAMVSKSTVSQYLNERYKYMSVETKQKIKEAIEELNYRPNYLARSLKQKKTSTIGIIVSNVLHRFSTVVSRSIEDYCFANNYHAIICNADDNQVKEKKYIEMLRDKQMDGLIIIGTGENEILYRELLEERYPVVFLDRSVNLEVPNVVSDNIPATMNAINHWIKAGHKNIGIITQPLTASPRVDRQEGYRLAHLEAGLTVKKEYIVATEIENMISEFKKMITLTEIPTAIFLGNDLVLIEIIKAINELNIRVPEDLALMVFDEIPTAAYFKTPLTTIEQPAYEMGQKAASLLLDLIQQKKVEPKKYVFKSKLIIRESSEKVIKTVHI